MKCGYIFTSFIKIIGAILLIVGLILSISGLASFNPQNISNNLSTAIAAENFTSKKVQQVLSPTSPLAVDWPQVQNNPQHTGYTSETLGTNIQVKWRHAFQPEKLYPQVQVIVDSGKVFVGTEMGNMYALDAVSGAQVWKIGVGSPILNSVAANNGKIFFGAMDGAVYALNSNTGSTIWKNQLSQNLGFSTAPIIAENKVMLGGRNGIFYALNPDNGNILWQFNAGAPILMTAAWDNGRVFFGTMDMYVYAVNSIDGTQAWKSTKIPGIAFKDYWPVVYQGLVYIRPMGIGGLGVSDWSKVADAATQQALLADYASNPSKYTLNLFRLDAASGQFNGPVIQYDFQTMHGATSPPCVDKDGNMIVPAPNPNSTYLTGWGQLNVNSRIITRILSDGTSAGFGNGDENMNLTCAGNAVLVMHTEEYNANFTGIFNLNTWKWTRITVGHTNDQMSTNTQGGGGNPASIANGYFYHISFYELIARTSN